MNDRLRSLGVVIALLVLVGCKTAKENEVSLSPAQQYLRFASRACDRSERQLSEITRVAEIVADRHIAGGLIGFPRDAWYAGHGLEEELWGRSGQIVHVSFDRPWKKDRTDAEILRKKHQRVMLITSENPRPEWQLPDDLLTVIDMGWEFGDACVRIPGYPIRVLPPSGVMQIVAYETVNVEVLGRGK